MPHDPLFFADGEVDEIRVDVRNQVEALPPPRVPRDRTLTFGQMLAVVTTVGAVIYTAGYLVWEWAKAMK